MSTSGVVERLKATAEVFADATEWGLPELLSLNVRDYETAGAWVGASLRGGDVLNTARWAAHFGAGMTVEFNDGFVDSWCFINTAMGLVKVRAGSCTPQSVAAVGLSVVTPVGSVRTLSAEAVAYAVDAADERAARAEGGVSGG